MTAGLPVGQDSTSDAGAVSDALADAGQRLYHGFCVPGDYVLSVLNAYAPRVTQFLGLDAIDHASVASGIVSGVVWLVAILLIVIAYKLVRAVDRALTAAVERLYQALLRTARTMVRRVGIALRFFELKRQATLAKTEIPEQVTLTALEFAVLRAHARLTPGHLLTASVVASALKVRSSAHVEKALSRLVGLRLLHRTFGAGDGEEGYRLTGPGQLFLAANARARATQEQTPAAAPRVRYRSSPG